MNSTEDYFKDLYETMFDSAIMLMQKRGYMGSKQPRFDIEQNWLKCNPIIEDCVIGYITDKHQYVIGDGITPFNKLTRKGYKDMRMNNEVDCDYFINRVKGALMYVGGAFEGKDLSDMTAKDFINTCFANGVLLKCVIKEDKHQWD